jgi:hypothetical protein
MDLAAILFLLALLLAVSLYLVTPLLSSRTLQSTEETPEVSALLAERERLLTALQELDFDFQLGKIPAEDYPAQRADLLRRGADVLQKLDELAPEQSAQAGKKAQGVRPGDEPDALSDDEIESMLSARRKARRNKAAGFCPRCGKPVLITDQFCPHCGKALQ